MNYFVFFNLKQTAVTAHMHFSAQWSRHTLYNLQEMGHVDTAAEVWTQSNITLNDYWDPLLNIQ